MDAAPIRELLIGTRNRKKLVEIQAVMRGLSVELRTLDAFPASVTVEETGNTFSANAALKATQQARATGCWTLGEDSGLSVAALEGAPGVQSAYFAGPTASDAENNALLMKRMEGVPLDQRTAWYTCHACVADPSGSIVFETEARCYGRIVDTPRGVAGFGYDPFFEIPEYGLTFAELGLAVKSILSHRARALRRLRAWLAGRQPG